MNIFFRCGNPLTTSARRNPKGNTHHFYSSNTEGSSEKCVCLLSMQHRLLPSVWGGNGRGDRKGGKSYWGKWNDILSEIIRRTELKIPSQLSNLVFFLHLSLQGAFSLPHSSGFPSFYRDDLCRQF